MMTRIYTWSYTLKIASATNVTQPLASKKKKKTTLLYVYVSKFLKKDYACTQIYLNIFTNNQATIHDLVLLSNIYIYIYIYI